MLWRCSSCIARLSGYCFIKSMRKFNLVYGVRRVRVRLSIKKRLIMAKYVLNSCFMVETLKLIHFFLTSYIEWAFSKAALVPNQRLFIFFHSEEIVMIPFAYTSHFDAVIIMFFTFMIILLPVLYGSTVYDDDFFGVECDVTERRSSVLDDPDYVFFYSPLREASLDEEGDTSEEFTVHENSAVAGYNESGRNAYNYAVYLTTFSPYG